MRVCDGALVTIVTCLALTEYIMSELNHIMPVVVWILWSILALYALGGAIWSHFDKGNHHG